MADYQLIPIELLNEPPLAVRAAMDERKLEELADSIRSIGLLQPLVVTPDDDRFEIVAGHRRLLAARLAHLQELPCIVYQSKELAKEAVMLHENIYREDLTAAEEGIFYAQLLEKYDLTEDALCRLVRQTIEYINVRLDLVRGDPAIFEAVQERKLTFSAARELLRVNENTAAQVFNLPGKAISVAAGKAIDEHRRYLLQQAIESGASARVVRQWVDHWKLSLVPAPTPAEGVAPPSGLAVPVDDTLSCHLCGGSKDPQNLVHLYVHWWEKKLLDDLINRARSVESAT